MNKWVHGTDLLVHTRSICVNVSRLHVLGATEHMECESKQGARLHM